MNEIKDDLDYFELYDYVIKVHAAVQIIMNKIDYLNQKI